MRESFPEYTVRSEFPKEQCQPPFQLIFEDVPEAKESDDLDPKEASHMDKDVSKTISVVPYKPENRFPYELQSPKKYIFKYIKLLNKNISIMISYI